MVLAHEGAEMQGKLRSSIKSLGKELFSAVFVAALFLILQKEFGIFSAIDGYAFLAIGNLSGSPEQSVDRSADQKKTAVVLIDRETYESRYLDRSPLNRCELKRDLKAIYDATPRLVVVDLDISPALWLKKTKSDSEATKSWKDVACPESFDKAGTHDEGVCELQLYCAIKAQPKSVKTVLMTPFAIDSSDPKIAQNCEWRDWMQATGVGNGDVRFGNAELPVNYGLVIKHFDDPRSLSEVARGVLGNKATKCPDETPFDPRATRAKLIDPHQYLAGVKPIALNSLPLKQQGEAPTTTQGQFERTKSQNLAELLSKQLNGETNPVVFYGAGFGEADTYLTPFGELYGVEVHAASYLSQEISELKSVQGELSTFAGDVLFALAFGIVIAFCWSKYYDWRDSDQAVKRQLAPVCILGLTFGVLILVGFFGYLSYYLLKTCGVWLSPVAMAVGKLIDSFVSGSVQQAMEASNRQKERIVAELSQVYDNDRDHFKEAVQKLIRPRKRNLRGLVTLWKENKRIAATLLLSRYTIVFLVLWYAGKLIFVNEH